MTDPATFPLWTIIIKPATFPISGEWLIAQIPGASFHGGDWFVFPSSGSPADSEFSTTIGNSTYTFTVQTKGTDTASGSVTASSGDTGTWSAKGTTH
jgi:hypothetical protein